MANIMSIQKMKQHIIEQLGEVKDENILSMLDEELAFYLQNKQSQTDLLSEKDLEELILNTKKPWWTTSFLSVN